MPTARFDSNIPVEVQLNDYSCSVGATYWCLRTLGFDLMQTDLESLMVPGLVSPSLGLLDGSGATIAALLRDRFGLAVSHASPVAFDDVAARAGQLPIAIGGARWYVDPSGAVTGHWVAVRSFDGSQLVLANPGGSGPNFGQQTLDRAGFEQRAPFAAVWILAGAGPSGAGPIFRVANTNAEGVNLRADPATTASIVRSLAEGTLVSGAEHAWRAVVDASGAQGWMANEYLAPHGQQFQVANTGGSGANVRPQPSTDAPPVTWLAEGATVSGDQRAWRQVTLTGADGQATRGWIADEFLVAQV